jgi:hypothetical protein
MMLPALEAILSEFGRRAPGAAAADQPDARRVNGLDLSSDRR